MVNARGSRLRTVACGAPLDVKNLVSDSGWREAPRLRDMTEFQFGASTCQVEGEIVPVAEINLGQGNSVFFEHHVLLWKDEATRMSVLPLTGGVKRALAGMPFIISVAHGPGRIAFSRDATGELVVLPIHPGQELVVRGRSSRPSVARSGSKSASKSASAKSRATSKSTSRATKADVKAVAKR